MSCFSSRPVRGAGLLALAFCLDAAASQSPVTVQVTGMARAWASFNLQDHPETVGHDRHSLQMLRVSGALDAKIGLPHATALLGGRADYDADTAYRRRLEDQAGNRQAGEYNRFSLRTAALELPVGPARLTVGRQQVVWGVTDFFHATNRLHGYDYRWRSFLEPEPGELRKPLNLVRLQAPLPRHTAIDLVLRPPQNRQGDIGNTYDLFGGRWANQPNKGLDFFGPTSLTYDYDHPAGRARDVAGGVQILGTAGAVSWSLSAQRSNVLDPVVNPSSAIGATPFRVEPRGPLGDFIFPLVNVFGGTGSIALGSVTLAGEVAYMKNTPFNHGTDFLAGGLPGFAGIVRKDLVTSTAKATWLVDTPWLGTSSPTFVSAQVFNATVLNFDRADDIVYLAGFGLPRKRHSAVATLVVGTAFRNDRIRPGVVTGIDVSYGGGFFIPSVEFGPHAGWTVRLEADLFFPSGQKRHVGQAEQRAGLFGYYANNNQFLVRVSRQF